MKNNGVIKFIAVSLLIAFLSQTFLSCAKKEAEVETNKSETTTAAISENIQPTTVKESPDLPEKNFDEYNFKIFSKGNSYNEWANFDIFASEETGEPINDAVYRRNRYVENKFNIKIVDIPSQNTSMFNTAQKVILAGSDEYDAITANMYDSASLTLAGALEDLKKVPNIDLSRPWWDQRANIDLTLNHKLYFTVGDLFIMDNDATWLTIFNKQLVKKHDLEDPYALVRSNQWTFDKYYEMLNKNIAQDINGDGEMTREDMYAQVSQGENTTAYLLAATEHFISKDENDMPILSLMNERTIDVVNEVFQIMFDRNITFDYWDFSSEPECFKITQEIFEDNRAVFKCTALQLVIRMRNMETEFGIVPMPKYDSNQERYGHYVHPTSSALSIPVTATNLERTGIILEALSAESRYTVRPAYYEISMKGKFFRDTESSEMLDIILDSRVFEIASMFNINGLGGFLESFVRPRSTDFVSAYEKKEASYKKEIEKMIAKIEGLK